MARDYKEKNVFVKAHSHSDHAHVRSRERHLADADYATSGLATLAISNLVRLGEIVESGVSAVITKLGHHSTQPNVPFILLHEPEHPAELPLSA